MYDKLLKIIRLSFAYIYLLTVLLFAGCLDEFEDEPVFEEESASLEESASEENASIEESASEENILAQESTKALEFKIREAAFDYSDKENADILKDIPAYAGKMYINMYDNKPLFGAPECEKYSDEFYYSELDDLGRAGMACSVVGKSSMPVGEREDIFNIEPTGWHSVRYDVVEGGSLYNRCHLIGYQLGGANDGRNIITGTRYFNVDGMLPFENRIHDYVVHTNNHVLYRVTPLYEADFLVASGVLMEAYSLEDNGEGLSFNVFVYNVQPQVEIDYSNGESRLIEEASEISEAEHECEKDTYILNTNSHKIHYPYCDSVFDMSEKNKKEVFMCIEEIIEMGYTPCRRCIGG